MTGRVMCDASAAIGVLKRQGSGRTRHSARQMYGCSRSPERGGAIKYNQVEGKEDVADLFTTPLGRECAERLLTHMNVEFPQGKDEIVYTINAVVLEGCGDHQEVREETGRSRSPGARSNPDYWMGKSEIRLEASMEVDDNDGSG